MVNNLKKQIASIAIGLLLIIASVGSFWWEFSRRNNPLDQIPQSEGTPGSQLEEGGGDGGEQGSVSLRQLDEDENFIPLLESQPESASPVPGEDGQTGQLFIPDRIVIPAIHLDAPVVPVESQEVVLNFKTYNQWLVPDEYAAGWHSLSAPLGVIGNTVLNGHHNIFGKVFENLVLLQVDDLIQIYAGEALFQYQVETKMLLPERYQYLSTRMENARWLAPSED